MPALLGHVGWYGTAVAAILLLKLALSIPRPRLRRRALARPVNRPRLTVAGVITVYNEDPDTLAACLDSLLAQTRLPDALTVVDDASRDRAAVTLARSYAARFRAAGVDYAIIEFPVNQGKRHGLAAGFRQQLDADIYLCVDSDTVLAPDAVELAMVPLARRRVHCVTGLVLALNRDTNLLTRLIDMRYVNAFLGERVAYSRLGSVLCACGSLALYRGWIVRHYLDDFLNQHWLGRPATFGDDRRLTSYCLRHGRAVIQPTAVARTAVPERLGHYLRQQTRWTKSFIRESLLMVATNPLRACWWLNALDLTTWTLFTCALLAGLAGLALHPQWAAVAISYPAYVCVAAWVRSLHYLRGTAQVPPADRIMTFLAAPVYALMNLALLVPLRLWALATMRDTTWGTRARVEIGSQTGEDEMPTGPQTVPLEALLNP